MNQNKAIVKLTEFPLHVQDFKGIPDDQVALLGIASYAASEINAFSRLFLYAEQDFTHNKSIDPAIFTQIYVVLRSWSARLFELSETISSLSKKKGTKDEVVVGLAQQIIADFGQLEEMKGHSFARNIRNEATNHYPFAAAKKNIKHLWEDANVKFYMHSNEGSSFYPMGEAVMFETRLLRQTASDANEAAHAELFKDWLDWNLAATKWARCAHASIAVKVVFDRFPDRYAEEKVYFLDPALVGPARGSRVPIFIREE